MLARPPTIGRDGQVPASALIGAIFVVIVKPAACQRNAFGVVLCARIDYAYNMYQKLNKSSQIKQFLVICSVALLSSCSWSAYDGYSDERGSHDGATALSIDFSQGGLAVGAVVNAHGRSPLRAFERWKKADQLASHILYSNPQLQGSVDSYEYVSKRVGEPFESLIQSFRLEGDLSDRALQAFKAAELRRRYLMLVSISPHEESIELQPELDPVIGQMNREIEDYYDARYQTIRLSAVRVQVYDTQQASKVFDQEFRSDDGGVALASERQSREYVGNSLLAALTNSAANGFKRTGYPAAPDKDDVMIYIWQRIANSLPGAVR